MSIAVSIGPNSISLYVDGDYFQVEKSHANYEPVLAALRKNPRDQREILGLVDMPRFICKVSAGRVEVSEDEILFSGQKVSGYMVDRMMEMAKSGDEIESWALFMDNLMDNPLPTVREDLYKWMEAGKMPITPDGCIIAFKKVKADYRDVHSGKFDNSVGAILEMPREACDTNRNNTCSTGFHFCSAGYLSSFSGSKVMVVKINPRDVTAIPSDYNNHKARCCRYVVTAELKNEAASRHKVWTDKNMVNLENPQELPDVLLPRKGKTLAELAHDPARVEGPAPDDDLAVPGQAPVKRKKSSGKKTAPKKVRVRKKASPEAFETPAPNPEKKVRVRKKAAPKAATPAPAETNPVFTRGSVTFTGAEVLAKVAEIGLMKASAALNVPKSTLSGWMKKLKP